MSEDDVLRSINGHFERAMRTSVDTLPPFPMESFRDELRRQFFEDLRRLLEERPNMTAAEALAAYLGKA